LAFFSKKCDFWEILLLVGLEPLLIRLVESAIMADARAPGHIRFFAIADFGQPSCTELAAGLNAYAESSGSPDFILGLGDNFYPDGVSSVDDPKFEDWRNVYLKYENLKCPWHLVLGNHDYLLNHKAQIDYTSSARNVGGLWHMPAQNYKVSFGPIDLFALDTNGCQRQVQSILPSAESDLFRYIEELDVALKESTAPMVTIRSP
jgi:hypothetical protein